MQRRLESVFDRVVFFSVLAVSAGVVGPLSRSQSRSQDDESPAEVLVTEQSEIREYLVELVRRMETTAKKLQATQGEEAQRLEQASSRIRDERLSDLLLEVQRYLKDERYIPALERQNDLVKRFDELLALLEARKFGDSGAEQRLAELRSKIQSVADLADRQEGLLKTTLDQLQQAGGVRALKALRQGVADLRGLQQRLQNGEPPDQVDPGATEADAQALKEALELATKLQGSQRRVNEALNALPDKDLGLREAREQIEQLDRLIQEAEDLEAATGEAEVQKSELSVAGARPSSSPRPSTPEPGKPERVPGGAPESKAAEEGKPAAEAGAPQEKATEKAPEKAPEDVPEKTVNSGTPAAGPQKSSVSPESGARSSEEAGLQRQPPTGGVKEGEVKAGLSPLEAARRQQALREKQTELEAKAQALAISLRELAGKLDASAEAAKGGGASQKSSPGDEGASPEEPKADAQAKESLLQGEKNARQAAGELAKGNLDAARKEENSLLQALGEARSRLASKLGAAEEANAREAAGASQAQAETTEAAESAGAQVGQSAQESTSDAARSALDKGAEAIQAAQKAMQRVEGALADGKRSEAKKSGREAAEDLAKAQQAFADGQERLGSRSEAEKRAGLQRKLARKTQEAAEAARRLERKLQGEKKTEAAKLAEAAGSLDGASRAMNGAAEASSRGDEAQSRKQAEEAVQRLERALGALDEEEKDQLQRLERQKKLKEKAREQSELAGQTRKLSRESGQRQGSEGEQSGGQLEEAAQKMDQAAGGLEREDAESAAKDQEEALAKLRSREREMREEEESLAELKREQDMTSLLKELSEVRESQDSVHARTVELNSGRKADESRRDRLKLKITLEKLAEEEAQLAARTEGLVGKLHEEASRVFSFVLKNIASDLRQVRDLLLAFETDAYTQFLEMEIVHDLDRLIASLKEQIERAKREREKQKQQGDDQRQGGGGGDGRPRLVSVVAELLMLKDMQGDINDQTRRLEDLRQASERQDPGEVWNRALERLAQKQGSISQMTEKLMEDFRRAAGGPQDDGSGPEGGSEPGKP
jgi:hypothetical protein